MKVGSRTLWAVGLLSVLASAVVMAGASGSASPLASAPATKPIVRTVTLAAAPAATAPEQDAAVPEQAPDPEPAQATADDDSGSDASAGSDAPASTTPRTTAETTPKKTPAAEPSTPKGTRIKHVFVIVLAGRGFDAAFGSGSAAAYLNGQLRPAGALLSGYRTLGRAALADVLALVSGQPPNAATRADCPTYQEIGGSVQPDERGVIAADGCVYPNTVTTIADQLDAAGKTWRAYIEDLDQDAVHTPACRHPASGAPDDTLKARPGDGYATRHNPFVYFHSLLDLGGCDASDGPLARLDADLAKADTTPNLAYIAPNLCHDGTESPCVDGTPGGTAAADAFLSAWVPKILASPAYRTDGLLVVAFAGDVAPGAADGPVRNGALVLSPFVKAGTEAKDRLDPYALLRTIEDALGLRPLARAAKATSLIDGVLAGAHLAQPGDD